MVQHQLVLHHLLPPKIPLQNPIIFVYITCADKKEAKKIGQALLKTRLNDR